MNNYQSQSQNQFAKAQNLNQQMNQESSSELAQSKGQISQLLLSNAASGKFEFGLMSSQSLSSRNQNANAGQSQLEIDQSAGQISQILSGQSK